MEQRVKEQSASAGISQDSPHTTIAVQKDTKERLDTIRAPGQCYDGFINELVEYWERYRIGSSLCGPGRPINQNAER
jgi:hypothetical protein